MKKKILLAIMMTILGIFVFSTLSVSAETNGEYTYYVFNGEATITYWNFSEIDEIVIPSTLGGYPVTSIGKEAFYACDSLTSITIPNSVKSIGDRAFSYCDSLTRIIIPDSVISIGNSAFSYCESLISVSIPDSVTSIGQSMFYCCDSLISVTIGNGVESIGKSAFSHCYSLTSITIPGSVTSIGDAAFEDCTGLTSVYITDLSAWCNIDFSSSSSTPFYCAKNLYLNNELVTDLVIPNNINEVKKYAFYNCKSIKSVNISDSVTSIGGYAFNYCSNLTSIIISDNVKSIGNHSFNGCFAVTYILIGNGVTSIGDYAFSSCSGLTNIPIPTDVTTIGEGAFESCNSLTSITIPGKVENIGKYAFRNCLGIKNVIIPDNVKSIGECVFESCRGLKSIVIGSGITLIPKSTFLSCSKLEYVALPKGLLYIRDNAFNYCSNIGLVFYEGSEVEWGNVLKYNRNENLTNAKIIYNAYKKTYKFKTNCDVLLEDITSVAIFSSPVVKNEGKMLIGWYDNEALEGEPISFPYYGNAQTLYAEWTDKKGTSIEDSLPAKENSEYTVTITTTGQLVYYEFVPKFTGEYRFYSKGTLDTCGYLYDKNQNQLIYDDDAGDGYNFKIVRNLTAGETYYIAMKLYNIKGNFTFVAETDCKEGTKTVCVTASSEEKIFITIPSYLPEDAQVILACYKENKLVETEIAPNHNETIYFIVSNEFDSAKVMVWDSFDTLKPIGEAETVK